MLCRAADEEKFASTCVCEDDPCDPACEECQVTELNADGSIKTTACINGAPYRLLVAVSGHRAQPLEQPMLS